MISPWKLNVSGKYYARQTRVYPGAKRRLAAASRYEATGSRRGTDQHYAHPGCGGPASREVLTSHPSPFRSLKAHRMMMIHALKDGVRVMASSSSANSLLNQLAATPIIASAPRSRT